MRYDVVFEQKILVNGKIKKGKVTKSIYANNSNELNNKIQYYLPALGKSAKVVEIKRVSIKEMKLSIGSKSAER
jgi:hypothetical protein